MNFFQSKYCATCSYFEIALYLVSFHILKQNKTLFMFTFLVGTGLFIGKVVVVH